jgi:multiple sugar transport system ATP-binding protein
MARVELQKVSKIYDNNVTAVENADLVINDREFVVLVGPSGCGKSTLLRMIAGLEEISSGDLLIDGKQVNEVPPKDRDIAMVFQNYALYPHMSVFENMAFGLELRKFPKEEIKKRVEEAAEILEIEKYLERKPKALSGGQRQRVAIGRAIVRKPRVFLFDEPLSNLDAKLRVQMRIEIKQLHNRLQTTMIYVTHDQVEAMTMGDRIVVLKDGLVQQVDSPLNLYNAPENHFVAGFIGSPAMNFISGSLNEGGFSDGSVSFDTGSSHNGKVIIGIRPENIVDYQAAEKKDLLAGPLTLKVDVVEPLGNEILVYLKNGTAGSSICMRSEPSVEYRPGDELQIGFEKKYLHIFDGETKLRR